MKSEELLDRLREYDSEGFCLSRGRAIELLENNVCDLEDQITKLENQLADLLQGLEALQQEGRPR